MVARSTPNRLRPIYSWLLGLTVASLVVLVPLTVIAWTSQPVLSLELIRTRSSFSGMIQSSDHRVMFSTAWSPADARSFYGDVTTPWDPRPASLIVPASDTVAAGTLELLERAKPRQLVVLGVPGASPDWTAVERTARANDVQLVWVTELVTFDVGQGRVTGIAGEGGDGSVADLLVQGPGGTVIIKLGSSSSGLESDISIRSTGEEMTSARLEIRGAGSTADEGVPTVEVRPGAKANITFAVEGLKVTGGTLIRYGVR